MVLLHLSAFALVGVAYALNGSIADYAPLVNQPCPDTTTAPLLRSFAPNNQSLHPREEAYVDTRLSTVVAGEWREWIGDIGYDLNAFNNSFPKVGLAISGGGYRAALYGAGVLSALDARNQLAKTAGTGGLLQVASYLAGLSGGSWLTGSLYMNDFPNIQDLVLGNGNGLEGWLLDIPLITPDGDDVYSKQNQDWYGSILGSVIAKGNTGIDTSLTDPWSRAISYHFLNQTSRRNFFTNDTAHGAGQLWSEVPLLPSWQRHQVPFPIIQAGSRPAGSNLTGKVDPSSTVYEMTPMEFGSWDPELSAMINMSYAGTHLTNGQPDNSTECTTRFDQTGFIMGTSASLFNQLNLTQNTVPGFDDSAGKSLSLLLSRQLAQLPSRAVDVANWPNPFHKLSGRGNFQDVNSEWLELIDGGSNQENVPLGQLFVKARDVDVVVAVDSTQETNTTWPNGTSLLLSATRNANLLESSHQPLPPLPSDAMEFVSTGVNMRATFFGCFPAQNPPEYPLLIFLPNSPPLNGDDPVNNPSTFKTNYSQKHTRLLIDQVFANAVGGFVPNTTSADADFGKALQCAAIDRARYKVNPALQRSAVCEERFERYCWNPNNLASVSELPRRKLNFVDPDSEGIPAVSGFLSQSQQKQQNIASIIGFVFLGLAIAVVSALLIWRIFSWRRAAYKKVTPFREYDYDCEEPPFLHHKRYSSSEKQSHLTGLSAFTTHRMGIDDEFESIRLW